MNDLEPWGHRISPCYFSLEYSIKSASELIICYNPSKYLEKENKIILPKITINNESEPSPLSKLDIYDVHKCFLIYCLNLSVAFFYSALVLIIPIILSWSVFPYWPILLIPLAMVMAAFFYIIIREYNRYKTIKKRISDLGLKMTLS